MRVLCLAHTACFQTFFLPLRPRADRGELPATAFKSERCPRILTRGLLGIWSSIPYWHAMAVLGKFEYCKWCGRMTFLRVLMSVVWQST